MTVFNCMIHGIVAADCPKCVVEKHIPATTPDTEARRQAVVEAAEGLVNGPRQTFTHADAGSHLAVPVGEYEALKQAVRALHQPTAVRPEEVEPGTRFRSAGMDHQGQVGTVVEILLRSGTKALGYHWGGPGGIIFEFLPEDRIIPI